MIYPSVERKDDWKTDIHIMSQERRKKNCQTQQQCHGNLTSADVSHLFGDSRAGIKGSWASLNQRPRSILQTLKCLKQHLPGARTPGLQTAQLQVMAAYLQSTLTVIGSFPVLTYLKIL